MDEREAQLDALHPMDRLTFLIGRVSQADVQLEFHLRHLWMSMVGPSYAIHLVPFGLDSVADQCKVLLRAGVASGRLLEAGVATLDAAKATHRERNRVVHDMWLPDLSGDEGADPETFIAQQLRKHDPFGTVSKKNLREVREVLTSLGRVHHRVSALHFSLPPFAGLKSEDQAEGSLRIIEDRFELMADGGARPFKD